MKKCHAFTAILLAVLLTLSAGAVFMPSVEYKEAPQIVEKVDESGNVTVGEIRDENGEVVAEVSAGMMTVTPISVVKAAENSPETKPGKKPSDEVPGVDKKTVKRLRDIEKEIAAEFKKSEKSALIREISKELNGAPAENIVVSDVFAITTTPEIEKVLKSGAILSVDVISQNITKEDEKKIIIYQKDEKNGKWKKVPFVISEDNILTLELTGAGEVVIFRDSEAAPVIPETAPKSPATGGDQKKNYRFTLGK